MRRVCVTGGAGFLGSSVIRHLPDDVEIIVADDLRTGRERNLPDDVDLRLGSVLNLDFLEECFRGCDWVIHLQAHADVRTGISRPEKPLWQNVVATSNVLRAMQARKVRQIAFASTSAIYGDAAVYPTPEDAPFPVQTSLYGASKAAGEGMITAYQSAGVVRAATILRFAPLLGEGYRHGHLFDFYRALKRDPVHLNVLGDGRQRKPYVYAGDASNALVSAAKDVDDSGQGTLSIFNVAGDASWSVQDSVALVCSHLGISPRVEYGEDGRGWAGDAPLISLDTKRIRKALGWRPTVTTEDAVKRTLSWFDAHPELFPEPMTAS